ncbi:30S ribosomal protein S3 [Gammaproteobacteria bacterium]|nr:30S ribosomal protein S3 [Gammaproteobacteria bacterium]
MGQKTFPRLLRLGSFVRSSAKWYARPNEYGRQVLQDVMIREHVQKKYKASGISEIEISRSGKILDVQVSCARPGVLIGQSGQDVKKIKGEIFNLVQHPVRISIKEQKKPELIAKFIGESIATQLEKRVTFRWAMKKAIQTVMRAGAKGVKIEISGRLGGAEIARSEKGHEGSVPLHTFRANIDYAIAEAKTTYGIIGVKVWIHRPLVKIETDRRN